MMKESKNRLSRIVTRTGDDGTTSLDGINRISKSGHRIEAVGSLDELNCMIGLVIAHLSEQEDPADPEKTLRDAFVRIQHRLFDAGGELCPPCRIVMTSAQVDELEKWAEAWNASLPPLHEFVLPGGTLASAHCHLARAMCRRAERVLVGLNTHEQLNPELLRYINRLSDVLFIAARVLVKAGGGVENCWQPAARG